MPGRLEILTKTYAPDRDLFALLHESVLRFTDLDVVHKVVVDDRDYHLFASYASERCQVLRVSSVLPSTFVKVPAKNALLNVRRPWPPVRGWVVQQLVKLVVAAGSTADVLLLMDSDVVLTHPVNADSFIVDGRLTFFRKQDAVHAGMRHHLLWHAAARELIGLSSDVTPPLDDHVDPFNVWSPPVVRQLCRRMTEAAGSSWQTAFASKLHVSEFILYGVYAHEFLPAREFFSVVDRTRCNNYWDEAPLSLDEALAVVRQRHEDDVALMISAKSRTDLAVRREAVAVAQGR